MVRKGPTVVLTLGLLSACGVGTKPDGGLDGSIPQWPEGTLELGVEAPDGGFLAMPAYVEASPGSQGGYHVSVTYRVSGEVASGVTFDHRVTRARDGVLVSKGGRSWDAGTAAPWVSDPAARVFLCPTPVGVNIVGEALLFQLTATKTGTLLGTAQATATFGCPPGDAFCERICGGD